MPSHRHSSLPLFSLALILASVYYADGFQLSLSTFSRTTLASVHANRPAATFRLALRPSIVAARMSEGEKEMTEAERKEYEELLKQAQQLQGTFDSMIGGAFAGQEEPEPAAAAAAAEPEEREAPKGFNIPIEEWEEPDEDSDVFTPEVSSEEEEIDPENLSEEERAAYEMSQAQNRGDKAFEACNQAIEAADLELAEKLHAEAVENYTASGILHPKSIFRPSFMECLEEQEGRIKLMKAASYPKGSLQLREEGARRCGTAADPKHRRMIRVIRACVLAIESTDDAPTPEGGSKR